MWIIRILCKKPRSIAESKGRASLSRGRNDCPEARRTQLSNPRSITTQPAVARLESGRSRPSPRTLERLAQATGSRLLIPFPPLAAKRPASP